MSIFKKYGWPHPVLTLFALWIAYALISTATLPSLVRKAQLQKILNPLQPEIFVDKLAMGLLPIGTDLDSFNSKLTKQGFAVHQIKKGGGIKNIDAAYTGTRYLPNGLLQLLTFSKHEIRVYGQFKDNKLVMVNSTIFWHTL